MFLEALTGARQAFSLVYVVCCCVPSGSWWNFCVDYFFFYNVTLFDLEWPIFVVTPRPRRGDHNLPCSGNALRHRVPHPYRNVQSGHAEGLTMTPRHVLVIGVGHREANMTWLHSV
jgi:hypothetical protein